MNKQLVILCLLVLTQAQGFEELYSAFNGAKITDADQWILNNSPAKTIADQVVDCGGKPVLGGPSVLGKGTVVTRSFQVPPHFQIKLNVKLWRIGSWSNNRMWIYADGNMWETFWTPDTPKTGQCKGLPSSEHAVEYIFTHQSPSLTIIFGTSAQNPIQQQAFGFRDLKLSYLPCPEQCGVCDNSEVDLCKMWIPTGFNFFSFDSDKDKEGWELPAKKDKVSECAGIKMYGGVNVFSRDEIGKIFDKLPPHYKIKVMFQFWKIDRWNSDQAQLYVDRTMRWSQIFGEKDGEEICPKPAGGADLPERPMNVVVDIPHQYEAARISIKTTLQTAANKASWGIRNFNFYIAKCAQNCALCTGPEVEECQACISPYVLDDEDGSCKLVGDWQKHLQELQDNFSSVNPDWKVTGGKGTETVQTCGGFKFLGGFNVFGSGTVLTRKFALPPHKRVRIVFEAWKIDDWYGDNYVVKADGVTIFEKQFGWSEPGIMDICGGEGFENMAPVDVIFGHEANELNLSISTTIPDTNKNSAWALREFTLYFEKPDQCATLYTECNYQGKSFNMCKDEANFMEKKLPSKVRSIQIPQGYSVELFDEHEFKGNKLEFSKNTPCIQSYDYVKFLQTEEHDRARVVLTYNQ